MTVATNVSRASFTGTGSAGPFTLNFRFNQNSDIVVIRKDVPGNSTILSEGSGYSLTGAGSYSGGSVTLSTALAAGEQLVITRVLSLVQSTAFRNLGAFFPEMHEDAFDRITMILQQLNDQIIAPEITAMPTQAIDASTLVTGGDGSSANPYTGWEAAINSMADGSHVVFPGNKVYAFSTGFNLHGSFIIEGSGAGSSTAELRYTGTGTAIQVNGITGARVTEGWVIRDLRLNGTNTGAIGFEIANLTGAIKSANGMMSNVVVTGFNTAGIDMLAAELCTFIRVKSTLNAGNGWVIGHNGDPYINTATNLFSCHASLNGGIGLLINGGDGFNFYGFTSESNGLEGIKLSATTATTVNRMRFYNTWLEANNTTRTSGPYYQFWADSTVNAIHGLIIENMQFALAGTGNMHIYMGAVGGDITGYSRVSGNSYTSPGTTYATVKNSAAAAFEVCDEDPANWSYSIGVSPGVIFSQRVLATGERIMSGPFSVVNTVKGTKLGLGGVTTTGTTVEMLTPNDVTGGIRIGTTETDATLQVARLKMRHYTLAEAPVTLLFAQSTSGTNVLNIGGGSSVEDAITTTNFYSAGTNTTKTGTIVAAVTLNGLAMKAGYFSLLVGANVASGNTITLTGQIQHITGTTLIKTINVPSGFTGSVILVPDGAFTTDTTGNIGLASTAVVGKAMTMTYDGTKWYPSY